jgi:hypothetical protein
MNDLAFEIPVKLRLAEGAKIRRISSAREASVLLESADWPGGQTEIRREACIFADDALAGHRTMEDARHIFVMAAREADILVEPSPDDDSKTNRIYFESSVCIQPHGGSTTREVKSVNGACEILIDWPHAKRGPYYQSAREVMQAALDGKATPAEAREAFAALAAHAGILVERGAG